MADDWMLIGRVAGPFGVRGEMKIEPLTDFPERFRRLQNVYLGTARDRHAVESARSHKGRILVRLSGVDSPEAVAGLRHAEIFVPRSEAEPLPPGHFYLDDALGLTVETQDGTSIGTVEEVLKTGSNEVFVVKSGAESFLVPVIKDAIVDLDLSARRVVIEPWVLSRG